MGCHILPRPVESKLNIKITLNAKYLNSKCNQILRKDWEVVIRVLKKLNNSFKKITPFPCS